MWRSPSAKTGCCVTTKKQLYRRAQLQCKLQMAETTATPPVQTTPDQHPIRDRSKDPCATCHSNEHSQPKLPPAEYCRHHNLLPKQATMQCAKPAPNGRTMNSQCLPPAFFLGKNGFTKSCLRALSALMRFSGSSANIFSSKSASWATCRHNRNKVHRLQCQAECQVHNPQKDMACTSLASTADTNKDAKDCTMASGA